LVVGHLELIPLRHRPSFAARQTVRHGSAPRTAGWLERLFQGEPFKIHARRENGPPYQAGLGCDVGLGVELLVL
jgi:hypothetical protein